MHNFSKDFNQARHEIINDLNINIDQVLQDIEAANQTTLENDQKWIIFQSLLGNTPTRIAQSMGYERNDTIRQFLSKRVYQYLPNLLNYQGDLNNWTKIIILLLKSDKYRLTPPRLNDNNFQASFGNQLFLGTNHPDILPIQLEGTELYKLGCYYQAENYFIKAWNKEKEIYNRGNPETLIYLNNAWIDDNANYLREKQIFIYNIAIVIPVYHNNGRVATELLRGIAQLQLMVNLGISHPSEPLNKRINLNVQDNITLNQNQVAIKILIVNENNNLYAKENQTAKYLASIAKDLNIIAVIGHYSSEMTKKAAKIYAHQGLTLITPSSTSNELANLDEISLFRMTTPDKIAAKIMLEYLSKRFQQKSPVISILYNGNSGYSCSLRSSIRKFAKDHPQLKFISDSEDFKSLNEDYHRVKNYLDQHPDIKVMIVIADGGIEPNSLQNLGLIHRINQDQLIVGSATLYHDNLLDWLEIENKNALNEQIVACIPWHYYSQFNQNHLLSQKFCQLGDKLWGKAKVTWRSATAFDAGLIIIKSLARHPIDKPQDLIKNLDQFYRYQNKCERGVTGEIKFGHNCDRINSPTEMVTVTWDKTLKKWTFQPI